VQDNGPGIVKKQIPLIFGKLLYGEEKSNSSPSKSMSCFVSRLCKS
jgi:DNA topoisomerase VI subunit B